MPTSGPINLVKQKPPCTKKSRHGCSEAALTCQRHTRREKTISQNLKGKWKNWKTGKSILFSKILSQRHSARPGIGHLWMSCRDLWAAVDAECTLLCNNLFSWLYCFTLLCALALGMLSMIHIEKLCINQMISVCVRDFSDLYWVILLHIHQDPDLCGYMKGCSA